MSKKVMMSIELLFTVPDDYELCNGGPDRDVSRPGCDGSCGGEDDTYFWDRVTKWLDSTPSNFKEEKAATEYVSMTLEEYEDPPEMDCRNYPV